MAFTIFRVSKGASAANTNGGGPNYAANDGPVYTTVNATVIAEALTTITDNSGSNWAGCAVDDFLCWDAGGAKEIRRITNIAGANVTASANCTAGAAKTVNVGGAWSTVDFACSTIQSTTVNAVGDDPRCYIGPGTYAETANTDYAGTATVPITFSGYLVTPGDECPGDVFPIITAADIVMTVDVNYIHGDNLQFDCTGGAAKHGISISGIVCYWRRIKASTAGTGASIAVNVTGASGNTLTDVHVTASTTVGIYANAKTNIIRALVEGAGTYGIQCYAASSDCRLVRCVVDSPGDDCYRFAGNGNVLLNSVGYGSAAGAGVQTVALSYQNTVLMGNIFDSNNQYGIEAAGECYLVEDYNAFRNNGVGERLNIAMPGANDITLTATPFTDGPGGDFTLNDTAGGGAAGRNAGPNNEDVGAYQHADPATAAATPAVSFRFKKKPKPTMQRMFNMR